MTYEATLEHARSRDAADPLREFRSRFALPVRTGGETIYFCGQSLGLQPLAAREAVEQELDDWARFGVRGHEGARRPWIHYHEKLASGLEYLTGAQSGEVVAMTALTVNLHLMLSSFFRPAGARRKILIEAGAFPSDRHAVVSHLEWHGLNARDTLIELAPPEGEAIIAESAIEACLEEQGAEIALVLWPGIQFRSGQAFDCTRIVRAARRAGCIVGLDHAHAIGNIPLNLHADDADFAVWCSYKYLNAGPGAIGGCFVHERHGGGTPRTRLAGWWGHEIATRFDMKPGFRAAAGAAGWQVSNPPILSAAPLLSSLEIFQRARIDRLRAKSIELTGYLEFLVDRMIEDIAIVTPRARTSRGAQLSLRIGGSGTRGKRVFDWLDRHGVICDWRDPNIIRVAPVPLYNTFEEVFQFSGFLCRALREA